MKGHYYCSFCVLLHEEGKKCPKIYPPIPVRLRRWAVDLWRRLTAKPETAKAYSVVTSGGYRQTIDADLRPDEDNPYKEMKLGLRQLEEAGRLKDPDTRAALERGLKEYERKYGKESRFFKNHEIPLATPSGLEKHRGWL